MVRLDRVSEEERKLLLGMPVPEFDTDPWVTGPPVRERRIALVTTAGLHLRTDRPFTRDKDDSYRVIPGNVGPNDLVMSHIAASFDRSGFQRDWNVVFPLDRMRELEKEGVIGSLADFHYSVSSARKGEELDVPGREIAGLLKKDGVNGVLLFPV
jgi:D-proline reductase (dithiol) PrdB